MDLRAMCVLVSGEWASFLVVERRGAVDGRSFYIHVGKPNPKASAFAHRRSTQIARYGPTANNFNQQLLPTAKPATVT